MKNISIIMARGIEGCGVTKYTVEQVKWLKKNGYNVKVFASKDKSFSRKNAHVHDFEVFKFADDTLLDDMITRCNESDLIIINSLPAKGNGRGKGVGDKALDNWVKALKSFKKPVVLIQHDHTVYSIKRNGALEEAIDAASIIFVHSTNNDFSQYVKEYVGDTGLSSFFGESSDKKILAFQPGIDFDEHREKYWKDCKEQDRLHHKWIGRTTSWKGYQLMFDWHTNWLQGAGYATTFEGIEKSPAWLSFKECGEFFDEMKNHPNDVNITERYGEKASVFSTFIQDELMERMSKVGFGYQLSVLKPKYIERSIEYTHQEIVAAGAVPVFRKEYGEVCIHRVTGDPLIHCKNNGTLWIGNDVESRAGVLDHIKQLNDDGYRNAYREAAFEFYKQHQDASNTFEDLMTSIKENL